MVAEVIAVGLALGGKTTAGGGAALSVADPCARWCMVVIFGNGALVILSTTVDSTEGGGDATGVGLAGAGVANDG